MNKLYRSSLPLPPLHIMDTVIERVDYFKLPGTWFQKDLKWKKHVEETTRKALKNLYCLRECRKANLQYEVGLTTYRSKIMPVLEYCSPVWGGLPKYLGDEVEHVQRRSLRTIGLSYDYLTILEETRVEAAMRYVNTIRKDSNHRLYQRTIWYRNHDYKLRNKNEGVNCIPIYRHRAT